MAGIDFKLGSDSEEAIDLSFHNLARIYDIVKLENLGDVQTRNDVTKALVSLSRSYRRAPSGQVVQMFYDATPKGHPMRKLMVDIWSYARYPSMSEDVRYLGEDFQIDLMKQLLEQHHHTADFTMKLLEVALVSLKQTKRDPEVVKTLNLYLE